MFSVSERRKAAVEALSASAWFQLQPSGRREEVGVRSEVNIELNFTPKLRGARSRLYRRRFLQVNTRWKALAEIYTMRSFAPFWGSFAPFSNLKIFVAEILLIFDQISQNLP